MFSVYPFALWWLRGYVLCLIIIIKSEVWIIIHCLGLGQETMVCAVCLYILLDEKPKKSFINELWAQRVQTPVRCSEYFSVTWWVLSRVICLPSRKYPFCNYCAYITHGNSVTHSTNAAKHWWNQVLLRNKINAFHIFPYAIHIYHYKMWDESTYSLQNVKGCLGMDN